MKAQTTFIDSVSNPSEPQPIVPNIKIFHHIGTGACGRVWLARGAADEWRAVKTVYRHRFGGNQRAFDLEWNAIKRYVPISSRRENLLRIFYVGPENPEDHFYYVMEVAEPQDAKASYDSPDYQPRTMESVLEATHRLAPEQCVKLGLALATALDELHCSGLVHRDIKPANIIFVDGKPKLADIGLVAILGATTRVGTEGYIAPEGPGKPPADVFSLGKVLYVASTGLEPGRFPDAPEDFIGSEENKPWLELNQVLLKACDADVRDRYPDAAALRKDLLLLEAKESLLELRKWRFWRGVLKKYGTAALLLVIFAGLAVAALIMWYGARADSRAAKAAALADKEAARAEDQKVLALAQFAGRELLEAQKLRFPAIPLSGWRTEHSNRLENVRQVRGSEPALFDEAAVGMAGPDLKPKAVLYGTDGSCVAFGPEGKVFFGGSDYTKAHLYRPGAGFQELEKTGEGPVGFDSRGRMLQFLWSPPRTFVLRDLQTGNERARFELRGWTGELEKTPILAVAPDMSKVAAAVTATNGFGLIEVWDSNSGDELDSLTEAATTMEFSPDARFLGTGDSTGRVRVRRLPRLEICNEFQAGTMAIHALAFGRDAVPARGGHGNGVPWLLATGDAGAQIHIYRLALSNLVSVCRGSTYDVTGLAFRADDAALLASGGREALRIWEVATGDPLLIASSIGIDTLKAIAFSPDGQELAVTSASSGNKPSVSVWRLEDGEGIQTLYGLGSRAEQVWWSPDGKALASIGQDWRIAVWKQPEGRLMHLFQLPDGQSQDNAAVVISDDGRYLAFACGREAGLYDLQTGELCHRWSIPFGFSHCLRFEGSTRLLHLAREYDKSRVRNSCWALRDLFGNPDEAIWHQTNTNEVAYRLFLPPKGNVFIVEGGPRDESKKQSYIEAFSLDTGKLLWREEFDELDFRNDRMTLGADADLLAYLTSRSPPSARLVTLREGRRVGDLSGFPDAIGPNGDWFAARRASGWSVYPKDGIAFGFNLGANFKAEKTPAFSPDGSFLAIPDANNCVLVADLQTVQTQLSKWGWKPALAGRSRR